MDTDELTEMAYECLPIAFEANDCLRAEIAVACSKFRDEDEYLAWMLKYVKAIKAHPDSYLDYLSDPTVLRPFKRKIRALLEHIEKTITTPIAQRGKTAF